MIIFKKTLPIFLVLISLFSTAFGQKKAVFSEKYSKAAKQRGNQTSYEKILRVSNNGNSVDFPYLSYIINAKNILYRSTGDIAFLKENHTIISNILRNRLLSDSKTPRWSAKSDHVRYKEVNNTEVSLYEGYLFRYVAEYCYILNRSTLSMSQKRRLTIDTSILESVFMKWYNISLANWNDDSNVQGIRTHIGSHWATVAMYLFLISENENNKKIFENTFTRYNNAIESNLMKNKVGSQIYYTWNWTWDYPFTNQQHSRSKKGVDKALVQDVTHGNHVVQYIIDSYELGLNNWTKEDLLRLSNTVKFCMWNARKKTFSDLIDGRDSNDPSLRGTGWKQSDGWMKLMKYDPELKRIYLDFYKANSSKIDVSYLNSQFFAVFYSNL